MKRILITVYVLYTDEEYDMFVPIGIKVANLIDLIQKTICELDEQNYVIHNSAEILLINEDGNVINPNNIVKFSGLRNGSRIIMK